MQEQTLDVPRSGIRNIDGAGYSPARLLDTLADWLHAPTDRHLAGLLQISLPVLRGLRSGRISVSPSLLLVMAQSSGRSMDELRQVLGEKRSRAGLRRKPPLLKPA